MPFHQEVQITSWITQLHEAMYPCLAIACGHLAFVPDGIFDLVRFRRGTGWIQMFLLRRWLSHPRGYLTFPGSPSSATLPTAMFSHGVSISWHSQTAATKRTFPVIKKQFTTWVENRRVEGGEMKKWGRKCVPVFGTGLVSP